MKMLFFTLVLMLSLEALADVSVIADLDDTIKITEASGDPGDLLGDKVYTGLPDFLKASKEFAPELYILSASPNFIRERVKTVLKKHGVTYNSLILRKDIFEGKFSFKVREIKKIMDSSSDDFILIGDDVGEDPEIYREIKRLYPERILVTYIHTVTGRAFVSDAIPYWTSFDLFLREFLESRMTAGWVEFASQKLLLENNMQMIFPKKAQCPTTYLVWEWQLATVFQPEADTLINKFVTFCQRRQSDIILQ